MVYSNKNARFIGRYHVFWMVAFFPSLCDGCAIRVCRQTTANLVVGNITIGKDS